MKPIVPCLWFDGQAEEAAEFYVSIFEGSSIVNASRYQEGSPGQPGTVMTVEFILNGQEYLALNGGPDYQFTPAISLIAYCDDQAEIDRLWARFTEEGVEVQCGWVTDKFGVSWQIVPTALAGLIGGPDREGAQRAFTAMLAMKKLDIAELQRAYDGV